MFTDRTEAGKQLAVALADEPLLYALDREELLVLSIPKGGVPIGAVVAAFLDCSHQIVAVKKIRAAAYPDLVVGMVIEESMVTLNKAALPQLRHKGSYIAQAIESAKRRVRRDIQQFRQGRALNLHAKVVILVDDGILTGETMKAALRWVTSTARSDKPLQVIVAVPVCTMSASAEIGELADKFVCLTKVDTLETVDQFYEVLRQRAARA